MGTETKIFKDKMSNKKTKNEDVDMANIDWLEFEKEIRGETDDPATAHFKKETKKEVLQRKIREQPLVPIGFGLTVGSLVYGVSHMVMTGNHRKQQLAMRSRLFWQAFSIIVIFTGFSGGAGLFKDEPASKD